jgi:hypothetical protein
MARRSTGGIVTKETSRGTSYGLRFRAGGRRRFVHLGYTQDEGAPMGTETSTALSSTSGGLVV